MYENSELCRRTKRNYYLANKEKLDVSARNWKRKNSTEVNRRSRERYDPKKNKEIKMGRVDKMREEMRSHYLKIKDTKKFKDMHRESGWRSKGINFTVKQYDELFESQGGRCALCQAEKRTLCVDHCHQCGKVRGLLCHKCNLSLLSVKQAQLIIQYLQIDLCPPTD